MIKVENVEVFNLGGAIRGMRNPMNSWSKSDSECCNMDYDCSECDYCGGATFRPCYTVGPNDLDLMQRLYDAGPEHAKYLRQIFVSMDIVAPLYWWKEFDTYKVGTTSNSCSTMHKIHGKVFTRKDFSCEHLTNCVEEHWMVQMDNVISALNVARLNFLETNDKKYWWQMIQLLPSSYNQRRTVSMSYANVMNLISQREYHKLDEWRDFVSSLRELPYVNDIRGDAKCIE